MRRRLRSLEAETFVLKGVIEENLNEGLGAQIQALHVEILESLPDSRGNPQCSTQANEVTCLRCGLDVVAAQAEVTPILGESSRSMSNSREHMHHQESAVSRTKKESLAI